MSFLDIATSALPVAQNIIDNVKHLAVPLLGLIILAAILIIFRPLITGMLRAVMLLLNPRLTREQKTASRNLRNMLTIRRIANDLDNSSPNMAAELRALASRG
jgi:hypothetical protein